MSWLYTIVFAGLMLSSQESSVPPLDTGTEVCPAAVEKLKIDETEKFEQTYPLSAGGRVNISNVNGSITVEAWDRNEVKLEYTKIADTKERLADVEVRIDAKPDYFSVETDYGNWKTGNGDRWKNGGKLSVEFRLMVPRGAVLNEVETVNGSVMVSNFVNITKVSAVNGSVNATNIRGTANLSTVNGEVKADFDRLETGSKISLETVNGRVNLVIPSDANATVRADSLNGSISNDFGLPVRKGKYVGRDLYGRIGSGEIQIKLNSVNGGLSIGRKSDGKNLSPATNLLPQKQKDEDDWDKDDEDDPDFKSSVRHINTVKLNKEVAKAVKESTKISAVALADAQRELKMIQPELAKITAESVGLAAEVMKSAQVKTAVKDAMMQRATLARLADVAFFPSMPRVEMKSNSIAVKGVPKVIVDAKGCSVTIRGWEKSEVKYRVTQFSDARNREPVKINEDHTDSTVTLKLENPSYDARNGNFFDEARRVKIEIFVPRKSNLKITANGEIRLEGVSGEIDLTGSDESLNVRDVDGKLHVSSSAGRIRVIGFKGEIIAESSDGMISLEGDFQKMLARSSDGPILLTLPEGTQADLDATCDQINGEGIALARIGGDEKLSKYRIGKGGSQFYIETQGAIRVRGSGMLQESF